MNTILKDRRINENLRQEFNRAYADLKDVLPAYGKIFHYGVVIKYLKAYNLLSESASARGRLIYKLRIAL